MDNKASKYEGFFVFSDEETFKKAIESDESCKAEHEKMQKVSELLGEVKFYYRNKNNKKKVKLRAVCACAVLLLCFLTFFAVSTNEDLQDTLQYGETLSAEELGFPVDSYGLLMVDE